jgi:hypothetical protein
MTVQDDATNEVARRLAAAYVSHIAGHKGVDRMLKRTPEQAGTLWKDLAELLFQLMKESQGIGPKSDLSLRKAITKYIQ